MTLRETSRLFLGTTLALLFSMATLADAVPQAASAQPHPSVRVAITNLASHVLSGEMLEVTDSAVRLRLDSGIVRDIPFSVLAAGERERLRRLAGAPREIPSGARQVERDLSQALARINAREKEGEIDADTANRQRVEARANAKARLTRRP